MHGAYLEVAFSTVRTGKILPMCYINVSVRCCALLLVPFRLLRNEEDLAFAL